MVYLNKRNIYFSENGEPKPTNFAILHTCFFASVLCLVLILTSCAKSSSSLQYSNITNIFVGNRALPDGSYNTVYGVHPYYNNTTGQINSCKMFTDDVDNSESEANLVAHYVVYSSNREGEIISESTVPLTDSEHFICGFASADEFYYIVSSENGFQIRCITYDTWNTKESVCFCIADSNGTFPILDFCSDKKGNLYLLSSNQILIFNSELKQESSILHTDSLFSLSTDEQGSVWACGIFIDPTDIASLNTRAIAPVDEKTASFGNLHYVPENVVSFCFGPEYDLFYDDDEGVWGVKFGISNHDFSRKLLFSFQNSGVSADSMILERILDPETMFFLHYKQTDGWNPMIYTHSSDIAANDIRTIEIAYHEKNLSANIRSAIFEYNQEHPETVINLKLISSENLMFDMVNTGYCPDIIISKNGETDIDTLLNKSLYRDLSPWLEQDEYLNYDNLFSTVTDAFRTPDGKIWGLSMFFSLHTLVSCRENLGSIAEQGGWTVSELISYAKSLPEGTYLKDELTQEWAEETLMGDNGYGFFIDSDNATCSFDSEEFINYLEFYKSLPKDYDELLRNSEFDQEIRQDYTNLMRYYKEGRAMLMMFYPTSIFNYFHLINSFPSDDYVLIGYPSQNHRGCDFRSKYIFMIPYGCDDSNTSWEIIKYIFKWYEKSGGNESGVPSLKSTFHLNIENKTGYEIILYNNGNIDIQTGVPNQNDITDRLYKTITISHNSTEWISNILDTKDIVQPLKSSVPDVIKEIIREEISAYTQNVHTSKECASIIQSRVSLYLAEHK